MPINTSKGGLQPQIIHESNFSVISIKNFWFCLSSEQHSDIQISQICCTIISRLFSRLCIGRSESCQTHFETLLFAMQTLSKLSYTRPHILFNRTHVNYYESNICLFFVEFALIVEQREQTTTTTKITFPAERQVSISNKI